MVKEDAQGYVYILTNPSFKEDWVKIGKSSRPVDVRSKELDNTAVPLPFEIFATLKTVKYNEVEKLVHKTIDRLTDLRIRQNREFFNVNPYVALDILKDIATTLDDAEIEIICPEAKEIEATGDVAKPLRLVKSFKWLATASEYDRAVEFVNSLPEPIEGSTATTIEEVMAEQKALQAEKETVSYKMKHVISKEWADKDAAKDALEEVAKSKETNAKTEK